MNAIPNRPPLGAKEGLGSRQAGSGRPRRPLLAPDLSPVGLQGGPRTSGPLLDLAALDAHLGTLATRELST